MQVWVDVRTKYHRRNLPELRAILTNSSSSQPVKDRTMAIFVKLPTGEFISLSLHLLLLLKVVNSPSGQANQLLGDGTQVKIS